ncbi:MAG: hypothetical protein FJ102_07615 [Deltaproteobacteria bacterium]|nr:hypothetical protein [Deltaproteobacteria bacterium]
MSTRSGQPQSRVTVVPVADRVRLQTAGGDSNTDVILAVDLPEIANWGPHTLTVTPHTKLESKTANFRWKAVLYTSIDGIEWTSTPENLFAYSTATSYVIQPDFTDKSKLGLFIRVALVCSPATGSAIESGVVTLALAFEFRS